MSNGCAYCATGDCKRAQVNRSSEWGWWGFGALVVVFMTTPLILVVLFSFGESALTNFPMGGIRGNGMTNCLPIGSFGKRLETV